MSWIFTSGFRTLLKQISHVTPKLLPLSEVYYSPTLTIVWLTSLFIFYFSSLWNVIYTREGMHILLPLSVLIDFLNYFWEKKYHGFRKKHYWLLLFYLLKNLCVVWGEFFFFLINIYKLSWFFPLNMEWKCDPLSKKYISVQFSCSVVSSSLWIHELQQARPPCPSPTPGVHSNSCPSSQWCHPAISSSVVPFSSCPQSLPASDSFPMSQLFAWGGQSTGVSAFASFLPNKTQDWSPLEWTGWISLQSKGLSRVLSNTTVQKHQFFGTQLSSQSNSNIHTWLLEKP